MDVRVLKSQNIFYKIDSGVAALLIDAGICEQFVPAPKPTAVPVEWAVVLIPPFDRVAIRHCSAGGVTAHWDGDDANEAFKVLRWDVGAQKHTVQDTYGPVPKEIIKDYNQRKVQAVQDNDRRLAASDAPRKSYK